MHITKHAKQRYVERIKGINDKQERDAYISTNCEQIETDINKMFDYMKLVYSGQIGGDKTTAKFYLHQDICFVLSTDDALRTVYKINFPFPKETVKLVINGLKESIIAGNKTVCELGSVIKKENELLDFEIDRNSNEIKILEEQIDLLKSKNEMLTIEKENKSKEVKILNSEVKNYAEQLFGNTEFKQDCKSH